MASEPPVWFEPIELSFAETAVGAMSEPGQARIKSAAPWPIFMPEVQLAGDGPSEFIVDAPMPLEIPPGGSASVEVRFAPAGLAARRADLLATTEDGLAAILMLQGLGLVPDTDTGKGTASGGEPGEPVTGDGVAQLPTVAEGATAPKNGLGQEPSGVLSELSSCEPDRAFHRRISHRPDRGGQ